MLRLLSWLHPGPGTREQRKFRSKHERGMCYVSHRYRCIYYNVPKAASTTVRALLSRIDPHVAAAEERIRRYGSALAENHFELTDSVRDQYFKFTFVRHPRERFVSAFREVSSRRSRWARGRPWYEMDDVSAQIDGLLADSEVEVHDEHLREQLYFLSDLTGTRLPLDFIGRVEHFDRDWRHLESVLDLPPAELVRCNARGDTGKLSLTPSQTRRVDALYQTDYAAFGYEK